MTLNPVLAPGKSKAVLSYMTMTGELKPGFPVISPCTTPLTIPMKNYASMNKSGKFTASSLQGLDDSLVSGYMELKPYWIMVQLITLV